METQLLFFMFCFLFCMTLYLIVNYTVCAVGGGILQHCKLYILKIKMVPSLCIFSCANTHSPDVKELTHLLSCVQSCRSKENTPPPLSRSHSSVDLGLQPRAALLSSDESLRSLKELWEKLDLALSPSAPSEGNHTGKSTAWQKADTVCFHVPEMVLVSAVGS